MEFGFGRRPHAIPKPALAAARWPTWFGRTGSDRAATSGHLLSRSSSCTRSLELKRISSIGHLSIQEIEAKLGEIGLRLRDPVNAGFRTTRVQGASASAGAPHAVSWGLKMRLRSSIRAGLPRRKNHDQVVCACRFVRTCFCGIASISEAQMYASISLWRPGLLQVLRRKPRHHLARKKRLLPNVLQEVQPIVVIATISSENGIAP